MQKDIRQIPILQIVPNRFQPRRQFAESSINELAQTIAAHGLLQPIVLREYEPNHYEIIAGERRYRAVQSLGWAEISAIVEQMTNRESAEMAVIENLQREDLNPIDEATAYQNLLRSTPVTQAQLAQRLGKSQSYLANQLRLLKLPQEAQEAIVDGKITARHGRALLALDEITQAIVFKRILSDHLTVSQTDHLIAQLSESDGDTPAPAEETPAATPQKKKNAAKKRRKNSERTVSLALAANQIKQSLKKIESAGHQVHYTEQKTADHYTIMIDVAIGDATSESKEEN
ncbi:Spo0J-like protein [Lapidilactobacillus concavus DSM 17758]|uniref:Spo0J-like protein n=1 Tax=Lapidilactobacillus concavus DSM 17758 TaxID=1423735 RepID=A0A0R1W7C0_9LACO|nr:ParB/RepB/Spo0J family partition protein [Lapidilactobacillus concavus]KRM10444.1 Spo0J-like protein [Lapidilactobacillus concavus DSM 17758]GEL12786.1 nucleoid occlusion protein [Lapidilactobacillus concavus]